VSKICDGLPGDEFTWNRGEHPYPLGSYDGEFMGAAGSSEGTANLYLILNFNERVPPSTTDTAKPREREEHVAIPAEKEPGSHDASSPFQPW